MKYYNDMDSVMRDFGVSQPDDVAKKLRLLHRLESLMQKYGIKDPGELRDILAQTTQTSVKMQG